MRSKIKTIPALMAILMVLAGAITAGMMPALAQEGPEPKSAPTGLTATPSPEGILVTWDDPGDDRITEYEIERQSFTPGRLPSRHSVTVRQAPMQTYTDFRVEAGRAYSYQIWALSGTGKSEGSEIVTIRAAETSSEKSVRSPWPTLDLLAASQTRDKVIRGADLTRDPIIQLDEDVTDDPLLPGVPKTYEGITLELIENTNFIMAWTGGEDNRVRAPQHEVYYLYPGVCSINAVADPPRKPYINVAGTAVTVSWIEGFGTQDIVTHDTYDINPTTARTERLQEGQCEETNLIEDPDPIIDDIWTNGTILYAKNGHNRLLEGYTPLTEAQIATRIPGTLTTREQDKDIPIPYTMSLHVGRGISGFANSTHQDERNTIWVRGRNDSGAEFTAFSMVTFKRTPERDIAIRPGNRIPVDDMHFTHSPTGDLAFLAGHSPSEVLGFTLLRDSDNRITFGPKLHTVTGISPPPKRLTGLGDHILISGDPGIAVPVDITTYNINNGETKKSAFSGQRGNESATCKHDQCTNSITTHAEGVLYLGFETNNIIYIFKNPEASFYASTLTLPENSPGGTTLDGTLEATTQTPDSQVWSLTGTHASCFSVTAKRDRTGGSLKKTAEVTTLGCPAATDYEAHENGAFNMGIRITHDNGPPIEREIMVQLIDVYEPPKRPTMESVTASAIPRELEVVWTHPVQTDRPPITGTTLRYCRATSGASSCDPDTASHWEPEIPIPGASPHRLSNLVADTTYIVQVKATNDEGIGEWSARHAGLLPDTQEVTWYGQSVGTTSPNQAPTFTEGLNITRSMAETFAAEKDAGRNVGAPVAATDQDGGTITYSLAETGDHAAFALDSATGQLKTLTTVNYNFETNPRYAVTLIANDGQEAGGKEDRTNVTIVLTDVVEKPLAPTSLTLVTEAALLTIDATWAAPTNTGRPVLTGYEIEYREKADPEVAWTKLANTASQLTRRLTDLNWATIYEVQVRATNDEGESPWTAIKESPRTANRHPTADDTAATGPTDVDHDDDINTPTVPNYDGVKRSVAETIADAAETSGGQTVGDPVTATDPDGKAVTYSLAGTDAALFSIDATSGQISTIAGKKYNHEARSAYAVTVIATDASNLNGDGIAHIKVAITVTDENEPPPTMSAPTLDAGTLVRSLAVSWTAPTMTGRPAISGYDVQYKKSADPDTAWETHTHTGTGTTTTITGLKAGVEYDVQVRAKNAEGTASWSPSGKESTNANREPEADDGDATGPTDTDHDGDDTNAELPTYDNVSRSMDETIGDSAATPAQVVGKPVTATDADGDRVTYSLAAHEDHTLFTIGSDSGQVSTIANHSYDFETTASYKLVVVVDDGHSTEGNNASAILVTISITDLDEAGTVTLDDSSPGPGDRITATLADEDTGVSGLSWLWQRGIQGGAWNDVSSSVSETHPVTSLDIGLSLRAVATYTDTHGSQTATSQATNDVPNAEPVFGSTAYTREIPENSPGGTVVTGGTVTATDDDTDYGDIITYSIDGTDQGFQIDPASGVISTKARTTFDYEASVNSHTITLRAEDSHDRAGTASLTIEVTDVNEAPSLTDPPFIREIDENSPEGNRVGVPIPATDPDSANDAGATIPGNIIENLTFTISGTGSEHFKIDDDGQIRTAAELDHETQESHAFQVRVTDGGTLFHEDQVTITILDVNESPEITNKPQDVDVAGRRTLDRPENVQAVHTYGADDPEDGATTWSLGGADAALFSIQDGKLAFRDAPNFESPADQDAGNTYQVDVILSDGTHTTTDPTTIRVTDVNEAPAFGADRYYESIDENTPGGAALGITLTASDPDEANDHTGATIPGNIVESIRYSISGDDHATFGIDAVTGELSLAATAVINHETKASYSLTVTVTDLAGSSDTASVAISVNDLNETPSITNSTLTAIGYDENDTAVVAGWNATDPDPADTISWALTGDDTLNFSISDSGQLSFGSTPDFENPLDLDRDNVYEITITAADRTSGTEKLTDSLDARITVGNVDEPGTVTLDSQDPVVNTPITATLTDPDGSISNQSWTWSRSSTPGGTTTLITGATQDSYTPTAVDINRYLTATVSYQDGEGTGKTALARTQGQAPNSPPDFGGHSSTSRAIDENLPGNSPVGEPVTADDPDHNTGDRRVYTIGGTDQAAFAVNPSTGQVSARNSLDHETRDSHTVIITATDRNDETGTITVNISVNDLNEAPEFPQASVALTIREDAPAGHQPGTVTATDVDDGQSVSYAITGTSNEFSIDPGSGAISLKQAGLLDYDLGQRSYTLTVTATDDGSPVMNDTIQVNITVTNLDEIPALTGDSSARYPENSVQTVKSYTAVDPENAGINWSLSGDDADLFDIEGGALTFRDPPDFEVPEDNGNDNDYQVNVNASDGATAIQTIPVTITVTDENEQPGFPQEQYTLNIPENTVGVSNAGDPVSAEDPDRGETLSYSMDADTLFGIETDTGQVFLKAGQTLDHETKPLYELTATVRDTGGLTAETQVRILVDDLNEPPVFDTATASRSVEEATDGATAGAAVTALDPDGDQLAYEITTPDTPFVVETLTGVISVPSGSKLDYETAQNHTLSLNVNDGLDDEGNPNTTPDDSIIVTISVNNIEEAGTVTLSSRNPGIGETITAELTDPDAPAGDTGRNISAQSWTWQRSSSLTAPDWTEIPGTGSTGSDTDTYTVATADNDRYIRALVEYTDPEGAGKTAAQNTNGGIVNRPPRFADSAVELHVDENSTAGSPVGAPVAALDPDVTTGDSSDRLTYSITAGDTSLFTTDDNGQIRTNDLTVLDHETEDNNRYQLTLRATDSLGSTADTAITIIVDNVNEPPELAGPASLTHPENLPGKIADYTALDPDAGTVLQWSLDGTDQDRFSVANGELALRAPRDYEAPGDENTDNDYVVTIVVSDGELQDTLAAIITISNEEEPGTITLTPKTLQIGQPLTAGITDPDRHVSTQSWSWERSPEDQEGWEEITGEDDESYTPAPEDAGLLLRVTAVYTDEHGPDKTASGTTSDGINNRPPVFGNSTYQRTVQENAAAGVNVGLPITADEPDAGDTVTYSITAGDTAEFTVDQMGQLKVADGALLDFETRSGYQVTLQAEDVPGATTGAQVNITLEDVNEAPVFPNGPQTRSSQPSFQVGRELGDPITAQDEDANDRLTYTAAGDGNPPYTINPSTGTLSVSGEITANRSHILTITATDPDGLTDTTTVTVNAGDEELNQAPTIAGPAIRDCEGGGIWCGTLKFGVLTESAAGRKWLIREHLDHDQFVYNGITYGIGTITLRPNRGGVTNPGAPFSIPKRATLLFSLVNLSAANRQDQWKMPNEDYLDWTLHISTDHDGGTLEAALPFNEAKFCCGRKWRWYGLDLDQLNAAWEPDKPYRLRIVEDPRADRVAEVLGPPLYLEVVGANRRSMIMHWVRPQIRNDGAPPGGSYRIEWKKSADSWDTAADVSEQVYEPPPGKEWPAYTIRGLTPGVWYNARVIAVNEAGDSEPSNVVSFTTQPDPDGGQQSESKPNNPATGAPGISGTPSVGGTLTADVSGIGDADGLENAAFTYQWLADDAEIAGATGATYTVVSGDEGKAIRVRVGFTDDAGNGETLTSAATEAVTAAALQLESATVDGAALVLTYNESLDEGVSMPAGAFTVTVDGSDRPVTNVSVSGSGVALTLSPAVAAGETVTVDYARPGGPNFIRDTLGNVAGSFSGQAVTNSTPEEESSAGKSEQPAANTPASGDPKIRGTAREGETLTVDTSGISDEDGLDNTTFSYQWIAGDADIQGATNSTYTLVPVDEGKAIKVRVGFTDDAGKEETLMSAPTAAVAAAPSNTPATGAPIIIGIVRVGETLTAVTSSIEDANGLENVTFTYRWLASGIDIEGAANAASYTLTNAELGSTIQVWITFTDDGGNPEDLTSAATEAVAAARPPLTAKFLGAPESHDGNAVFTFELRFSEEPKPDFSYTTLRDHAFTVTGGEVAGARRLEPPGNAGWEIQVRPGSRDRVGIVLPITTDCAAAGAICTGDGRMLSNRLEFNVAAPNTPATGQPSITGAARVGETLTAATSGIEDANGLENVTFTYRWLAGGTDIEGAVAASYTLTADEEGLAIQVGVSFTDDAGNPEAVTSAATGAVAPAPSNTTATGAPVISGTARVGETLTADTSGIADADGLDKVSYDYQWIAGNTDISGATGATYTLIEADEGKAIKVRVSFTDDAGNEESLTSAATDAVDAAAQPLSASLKNTPDSHDGETAFTFEIRFSEEPDPDFSYVTLQDHAFTVAGGSVEKAHRVEKPSNIRWRITVRPDGDGDVTITLPVTTDCAAEGAVCTEDGRMLSNRLELTVPGPSG